MKTVIRKGVFETNSSSTHSLSLKKVKNPESSEIDKEASFEIRSPLAKTVLMLGLIDNADDEFHRSLNMKDEYYDNSEIVRNKTINKIKEINPSALDGIDTTDISSYDIANILLKLDDIDELYVYDEKKHKEIEDEFFEDKVNFDLYFADDIQYKKLLLKAKSILIEEYAKIVNKPYDKAKEEIDFEAFAYIELKEALEDEQNAKEKVEKLMERDYRIKLAFERSDSNNLLEFAKKYLYDNYLEFKNTPGRKYCCHRYFSNGCLDTCDCGFESYSDICLKLNISRYSSESELCETIKSYLSDKYKVVAIEKLGYSYFIKPGDIY